MVVCCANAKPNNSSRHIWNYQVKDQTNLGIYYPCSMGFIKGGKQINICLLVDHILPQNKNIQKKKLHHWKWTGCTCS
jgi:hypothetical protein